jgi:hypothetical protein
MPLKQERGREACAGQPRDQVGSLGVVGEDPRLEAGVAQDPRDPLDARALIARRAGGVEPDQPPQELRGLGTQRRIRVQRHHVRVHPSPGAWLYERTASATVHERGRAGETPL